MSNSGSINLPPMLFGGGSPIFRVADQPIGQWLDMNGAM
jgi:hypothetical protein